MKKVAFIIGSGYLLISELAIAMELYPNEYKVAFILNHFKGSQQVYTRVKKTNVFEEVYYLPQRQIVYTNREKFKQCFGSKRWLRKHVNNYKDPGGYDIIIGGGMTELCTPLYQVSKRKKRNTQFFEVDDGAGFAADYIDAYTWKSKVVCSILRKHIPNKEMCGLYMFAKHRYIGNCNSTVYEIPDISTIPQIRDTLNYIYDIDEKIVQKVEEIQAFYLLSAHTTGDDDTRYNAELDLIKKLEEKIPQKIYVKKHPVNGTGDEEIRADIPMEILAMNCDMSQKVLISVFSTAGFASRVLWHSTFKSIFLFKLFRKELGEEKIMRYTEATEEIIEQYNCAQNVYVPETVIELFRKMNEIEKK